MEKNIPKFSSKVKQKLTQVPDDLFEMGKEDIDFKAEVLKRQYNKNPLSIFNLIKRMINESK
jgi:hypothetical protein